MRLLDRLVVEGYTDSEHPQPSMERRAGFLESQLVVIDNVAEYYFQERERRLRNKDFFRFTDFPCVMPPFPLTFLDMRMPASFDLHDQIREVGVMMQIFAADDLDIPSILALRAAPIQRLEGKGKTAFLERGRATYYLLCDTFVFDKWGRQTRLAGQSVLPLTATGNIASFSEEDFPILNLWEINFNDTGGQKVDGCDTNDFATNSFVLPALLGLSFMHCRNVKVAEEVPSEKLSKEHRKNHGRSLLRYRVLQIDHMKEILEREGHAGTEGLGRALHICRGHFAHYGEGDRGLLFGRHAGTFWRPMHVRGSAERGIVEKDYEVK